MTLVDGLELECISCGEVVNRMEGNTGVTNQRRTVGACCAPSYGVLR